VRTSWSTRHAAYHIMRKPVLWLVLLGNLLVARDLKASFYTVTGTADNNDSAIHGGSGTAGDAFQMSSLRGAILDANANTGPHTISLPPGTYTVSGELPSIVSDLNLTLQGTSGNPADTVLNQAQANQRFLETDFVNDTTPNNVVLTFANLTFTNGQATAFGGGVLLVGGLGSITTVSNCVFLNNSTSASGQPGGVIESSPDGDVIVQNCVFQGNASADFGGAIDFLSQTEETAGHGNLTVTGSSFIGNSSAFNGGAINVNSVKGTQTITLCNFTGNTATTAGVNAANGGAIAHYSGTMAAHFNRFFNNTAATAANGNTLFQAGEAPGTFSFDATDNWWGANSGPVANSILAVSAVGAGTWLQLEITPGVSTLSPGGSTSLTADLLNRNAGGLLPPSQLVGLPAVPDPTILFHNPVLGTLSGASSQFINGAAAATFTAGAAGGIASAQVTLDNQTMTATMLIPTTVSSINRVTATPSNLGSVQWTVTFGNAVSGVSAANFSLVNSGLGGTPTVTGASPVGAEPTATWTVTASTGTGTGTLGLNMVNATGVSVPINSLPFVGQVYDIDKTPPTVTGVSATTPDGSYTAGAIITITVGFTKPVLVTGTPQLALNSGASASANYASGSGTSTLTFTYLVGPAEDSAHLDYSSASALTLNGGTMADTVGNNATLTLPNPGAPGSLGANNNIVIQASTTTAVVSNPNPSVLGQPATFSAIITSAGPGTPTGTAQFVVDGSNSGPPVPLVGGVATFTTSTLSVGTHAISAVYSGDVVFLPSASSPPYSHVVNKAATTTTVGSSPNPSVFGQPVTLTATASVVAPGAGTPTGTASFFDGATLLGTVTLNAGGQASFTTSTLAVGNHSITAVYSGDANFTGNTSPVASPVVNPAATTTTVASSPNPSVFGQPVTLTATASAVSPGAGTPTGTVSFFDGATLLGTATLNAGGQATFTTSTLAVGTRSITAVYGGDANFTGSTSPTVSPVVNQAATTTTVASSPNPSVFGQPVTLTATTSAVAPGAGTPTGTASFFDGATLLGTATLNASGQASFTTSTLAVGTHSITAVYAGDANFTGSTSPAVSPVVNKAATTTTVVASPNPSVFGQPVTLTATTSAVSPGTGTPTGTASFFDGATLLGTAMLNAAGQAAFTTSTLALGTHSITAVYAGDANFTGSTSPAVSPVVNKAASTTTVASSPNPSVFGQSVTLTATATAVSPGAGTPTGTASFFDGATLLGTATLNAAGQASFTTSTLAVGTHSITAVYAGDANFTGSTSPVTTPVVNQAATTMTLASSPNPSAFGQPVTLTATASALAPGAGTPTGTASFFDGATLLGTGTLNAAGKATFTTTTLALGTHSITAVYSGDANYTGSTSSVVSPVVNQTATTTTLSSSPNPSVFGETVTLTVIVSAVAPGAGVPTGMATFAIDGNTVASVALTASGQAVYSFSTVAIRTYVISATYSGDANFKASTSATLSQNVICASPIFVDAAAGSDGNSGATPTLAKKTIQAGVDATCDSGTVMVKAGTYQPTASLRVDKSVNIVGAGPGSTMVSGSGNGGNSVFSINASGTNPVPTVLLSGLAIQDGTVSAGGGGIENVHATLTVSNCTISANRVTGTNGLGGGIQNNGSTLTVVNSTISGNQATGSNSFGGGLFNQASTATIVNSTISGNQAGGQGGGIYTDSGSTLTVADSTITGNRGTNAGGGLYVGGAATLDNTIVAGNFSVGGSASSDLSGGIVTNASHNLIGDAGSAGGIVDGVNGNIVGNHGSGVVALNAILNPTLANNGGPTLTHALVPNSPALDHGFNFSEVQQIAVSGSAGTFTLTFNGQTTAALAFNATAAQVQTALNALSSIGGTGGSVLVAASAGSYTVTFGGALAGADQPQIVAAGAGGAAVSVTTLVNGLLPTDQRGPGFPRVVNNTVDIGAVEFATFVPATTVASINRLNSTPSNQGSVQWTVVFANAVSGVAAGNFSLANSGLGGSPAITNVTPVGSAPATTWAVGAITGTGDGTLGLNLDNASGISIQVNSLPFVGQVYTIDRTLPTVTISAPSVPTTASGPVSYTVTYTDADFGSSTLAASNITLNATETATGTITVIGTGNTRTVTITNISGHGTLGISLAAGTAVDLAGNLAPAAGPSATSIVNHPPVAGPVTVTRLATAGVTIPVATILANDTDPDGDVLSVTAVQAPSSGKATVSLNGTNVVYTPNPGFITSDSFTYTVSDTRGGTATGTVTVNVTNVTLLGRLTIQNLGGGSFQVSGSETPGQIYTVQYATSFAPPNWKTLRTITAGAQGAFSFTDTSTNSSRNYRLAFP